MTSATALLQAIDSEMQKAHPGLSEFNPGDTVVVQVRVREEKRTRLQSFEGIVIAKRNRGYQSSFTVRKISHGVGVERVFPMYGSLVESVTVKRRGDVRRAKLYYMRNLSGKAARIKEKLTRKLSDVTVNAREENNSAE